MTAAVFDLVDEFKIEQGAAWRVPLRFTVEGVPVDITGWDFRMQIREKNQDGPIVLELTVANTRIIFGDPADGQILLTLTDAETDPLTKDQFKAAVYDLEGIEPSPSDVVHRLLEGDVDMELNITR